MLVTVNGKTYVGMGVLPKADNYVFQVEARGDLDLFTMETCSRYGSKEKAWNVQKKVSCGFLGWGKCKIDEKRKVNFNYKRTGLELRRKSCVMRMEGLEKIKGRHSTALFDFESDDAILPALVDCNGFETEFNGVSYCELKHGLYMSIQFPAEVIAASKCNLNKEKSNYFEIRLDKGDCVYKFRELGNDKREHRLVTYGFEQVPIRED